MIFRRSIREILVRFLEDDSPKTILVQGPNGCGKSFFVRETAKGLGKKVLEIDFKRDRKRALKPFRYQTDLNQFYRLLQLTYDVDLVPGKTVIVFNDIQEYPEIRSFLRRLIIDNRFKYIQTGSLINLWDASKDDQLVDLETIIDMGPMTFPEFLLALSKEELVSEMEEAFSKKKNMDGKAFLLTEEYYRNYLVVGGMPEAVEAFMNGKSFKAIDSIKKRVVESIRSDYARIDEKRGHKTEKTFDMIVPSLLSKGECFKTSAVFHKRTAMDAAKTLMALKRSGATLINRRTTELNLSMPSSARREKFKLYFSDVGTLSYLLKTDGNCGDIYKSLIFSAKSKYVNIPIKNAICSDLCHSHPDIYFYRWFDKMNHLQEIDFLFFDSHQSVAKRKIIPVYVLPPYARTDAPFKDTVRKNKSKFNTPYVLYKGNLKSESGIVYLPYFMAYLL